jgi:hypothetical protein
MIDFNTIKNVAISVSGPVGHLAAKAGEEITNKENFSQNGKQNSGHKTVIIQQQTEPPVIQYGIYLLMVGIAVYLHYKCNNGIGAGIFPAIFCPSCYLVIYFVTSSSCPSAIMAKYKPVGQ